MFPSQWGHCLTDRQGQVGLLTHAIKEIWCQSSQVCSPPQCEIRKDVSRHEPVVFEYAAVTYELKNNTDDVLGVVQTTVLTALKLQTEILEHLGQVTALHLVEAGIKFSRIDPFDGIARERDSGQHTLREETLLDVPGAGGSEGRKTEEGGASRKNERSIM